MESVATDTVEINGWELSVGKGDPRVQATTLARRLGFSRARKVKDLIERNRAEFERYGELDCRPVMGRQPVGPNGRGARTFETDDFWLNEPQALLLAVLSRTTKAADVREQLIRVFMAVRRGQLTLAVENAEAPVLLDILMELRQRVDQVVCGLDERMTGILCSLTEIGVEAERLEREPGLLSPHDRIRGQLGDTLRHIGFMRRSTLQLAAGVRDAESRMRGLESGDKN